MAELRPVSEGGRSKYVLQLEADDIQYSTHRECDEVIRNLLNRTDNARLRYPQSRQDYHDLVVLIIENYPYLIDQKHITHYSDIVKKNYTGADVPEDVFGEVKRIMDICLEHGRFRDVRVLGEFYRGNRRLMYFVTKAWWGKVARYYFPEDHGFDW